MNRYPASNLEQVPCRTEEESCKILEYLLTVPAVAIDTETTGYRWWLTDFRVFYVSFCDGLKGYGMPMPQPGTRAFKLLERLLGLPHQIHAYQNFKFDGLAFRKHGIEDQGEVHDTMIMAHILDERGEHNLEYLAANRLTEGVNKLSNEVEEWFAANGMADKEKRRYDQIPQSLLERYAIQDTVVTWFLFEGMIKDFAAEQQADPEAPSLERIYRIERAVVRELVEMEWRGYHLDRPHFAKIAPELRKEADAIAMRIDLEVQKVAGKGLKDILPGAKQEALFGQEEGFNLASPEHLAVLFFDVLKIPKAGLAGTKGGRVSLNKYALENIEHPVAELLLEWRKAGTLLSHFIEPLSFLCDKEGNLHGSFKQMGTVTGRMSSESPNMQNFPRVNEDDEHAIGNKIRAGFIPRPGYALWFFDYSQIELRILAHYCNDPVMVRAFRENKDLHRETAAAIYNKKAEEVTSEERNSSKKINFTTVYGGGKGSVARQLKWPEDRAGEVLSRFFTRFPGVKQFKDKAIESAKARGWVRTYWGRRRHFLPWSEVKKKIGFGKGAKVELKSGEIVAEPKYYTALNGIVSGTATGDLSKLALARVGAWGGLLKGTGAHVLSFIHDEITVEIPIGKEGELVPKIKEAMEDFTMFRVPIKVDIAWATTNWAEKEKWKN